MQGTLVDATIIEASSFTRNRKNERDPAMHQTKKGNEWHLGMKNPLHGDEEFVSGDAGYQDTEEREELQDTNAE